MKLYPEFIVPPDQKKTFLRDRKGCVAGRKLIEQIPLEDRGHDRIEEGPFIPGNWEFVLRGIYHGRDESTDERLFFFHWDYLNEWLKKTAPRRADQVGWYIDRGGRPEPCG